MNLQIRKLMHKIRKSSVVYCDGFAHIAGVIYERSRNVPLTVSFKGKEEFYNLTEKLVKLYHKPCVKNVFTAYDLCHCFERSLRPFKHFDDIVMRISADFDEKNAKGFSSRIQRQNFFYLRDVAKTFFTNVKEDFSKTSIENHSAGKIDKNFILRLQKLAENNNLDFKDFHYISSGVYEFYLDSKLSLSGLDFWFAVIVLAEQKKIFVIAHSVYEVYDLKQYERALLYLEALLKVYKEKIVPESKISQITVKQYEIAKSSIKALLDRHFEDTGLYYAADFRNLLYAKIEMPDLKGKQCLHIPYLDFLENPSLLRRALCVADAPLIDRKFIKICAFAQGTIEQ